MLYVSHYLGAHKSNRIWEGGSTGVWREKENNNTVPVGNEKPLSHLQSVCRKTKNGAELQENFEGRRRKDIRILKSVCLVGGSL